MTSLDLPIQGHPSGGIDEVMIPLPVKIEASVSPTATVGTIETTVTNVKSATTVTTATVDPAASAHARALDHLLSLQKEDGSFEGEMVWCTMILSQYVMVRTIVGRPFDARERDGILRHFRVTRTREGVWGLHPESQGYVFTTTLAYVALRLLGVAPDDELVGPARRWLREKNVLSIPSWGKYWLAMLDLYDYDGVHPCPPELHLLPEGLPFSPHRFYCHTRNIYTALSYLYGRRYKADLGPIKYALRQELYDGKYERIEFRWHRDHVAKSDLLVKPGILPRAFARVSSIHERLCSRTLRRRALDVCFEQVLNEQRSTQYQGLSPVNALLDCLVLHAADPHHPDLSPSLDGLEAWRFEDEAEGIRYAGARSSTWDTALGVQAILAGPSGGIAKAAPALRRAYRYLVNAQIAEELPRHREGRRDPSLGGWCFSDGAHRWPVSDCTAEAVCALVAAHEVDGLIDDQDRISPLRLRQATTFLLSRQNDDGGFGTYERRRGGAQLEAFNNTEMYGNCMTERSYIECTASSICALSMLRGLQPAALGDEEERAAKRAVEKGVRFLRRAQRADGSFPGFWGINFTYAAFHVVKALRAAGVPAGDPSLVRASAWLIGAQKKDGGFGEHYSGCLTDEYVEHRQSQAVMSSWALLGLMDVVGGGSHAVEAGAAWLAARARADGSFPAEAVNGVFFGSAMLDYRLYKAYFPLWALGRYQKRKGAAFVAESPPCPSTPTS